MSAKFSEITAERPTEASLERDYAALHAQLDSGKRKEVLEKLETLQGDFGTWSELTAIRASKNMADPAAAAEDAYLDVISPKETRHNLALKQRLLDDPEDPDHRRLEALVGPQRIRRWQVAVTTFNPQIESDLEQESTLRKRYASLVGGSAKVLVAGRDVPLGDIGTYAQNPDEGTRHEAKKAYWDFFARNGEAIDQTCHDLVQLRHGMANKLDPGCGNYIPLGYRRRGKIGYDQNDVAGSREQIVTEVVPLVAQIMESRRKAAGLDKLHFWDEAFVPGGNLMAAGGPDMLLERAKIVAAKMDPRLGEFVTTMVDGGYTDLAKRDGKLRSTFSSFIPNAGMPFAFDNCNGRSGDVTNIVHEIFGHGFQNYMSRHLPLDLIVPPDDLGECHSKPAEYLCYPHIGPMLEEGGAERYRRTHLANSLIQMPHVAYIDHLQHEIYANPSASKADRHEMARELQKIYMPWRDFGDIEYPAKGGLWQETRHVFNHPLYYDEYNQGARVGLQLLAISRHDYRDAMDRYVELCSRGGEKPFLETLHDVGLKSPFDPESLTEGLACAARMLGLETARTPVLSLSRRSVPAVQQQKLP